MGPYDIIILRERRHSMDRFRQLVKLLLFPKWWIVLLSVSVAAAGLIYAFAFGHQADWSAYRNLYAQPRCQRNQNT